MNIYLPPKFDKMKSYPVIYLLDGSMDEDFLHITGLVQFFNLTFKMPDTIVVGIANVAQNTLLKTKKQFADD